MPPSTSSSSAVAARSKSVLSLLSLVFLVFSLAIYPASWVFGHFYAGVKTGCFSDVCDHVKANKIVVIRKNLAIFYSFLVFTALVAIAAKYLRVVRRFTALRISKTSTVTLGEVAWFALAVFVAAFAVPATNWAYYYAQKEPQAAKGQWQWIHVIFEVLAWLSGDGASVIYGLALLPAAKYSAVNDLLGLPYTAVVRVHQWLGYATLWYTLFHVSVGLLDEQWGALSFFQLLFVPRKGRDGKTTWGQENYLFVFGAWATIALIFVVLTSLSFVRRKAYNVFYISHFAVILFILFSYFHASMSIFYAIPGLALWTLDGFIRLASRFKANVVTNYVKEECGYRTVTVSTVRAVACKPGQFLRVAVPAVNALEYHPWSVLRATSDSVTFLFAPEAGSDKQWTAKVGKYLDEHAVNPADGSKPPRFLLQGPFGLPSRLALEHSSYHSIVLYVGGTGVAPALAILQHILDDRASDAENADKYLATVDAKTETVTAGSRTAALHVYLFWAAPAPGIERLDALQALIRDVNGSDVQLTLHLYDTSRPGRDVEDHAIAPTTTPAQPGLAIHATRARPHLRALMNRHVVEKVVAAQEAGAQSARVGVFVCGPERFMEDALASVASFQGEYRKVQVETEVESYAL
ncbi:hypothetical protein DFJ73DRAFT_565385 [Zopfochytrium polystomum]|nr:hypothetical protein DFJ73DRAFT_565385 [Zopfochytrium polystomum]